MKRAYVFFLVLLFILTGCTVEENANNISVKDVCCPYEIIHQKGAVEITLHDGEQSGIVWRVETIPEDFCQVTQENIDEEYAVRYRLSGKEEGATQMTFTALRMDETVCFVLELVVNIDSEGEAFVSSYRHYERKDNSVEGDGLNYKWNLDINGILNFTFINQEDNWRVRGDGADTFTLSNMMSTSAGCKFSAQAIGVGQATITFVGENTQRTIYVVIQADDQGKVEVISVQEQ